ncbi:hypothetical protein F4824DRAFT_454389 [Ustulina deusta]|nr:hypothetical protein F4824DRAFT_454389 [Ustulina deusta]
MTNRNEQDHIMSNAETSPVSGIDEQMVDDIRDSSQQNISIPARSRSATDQMARRAIQAGNTKLKKPRRARREFQAGNMEIKLKTSRKQPLPHRSSALTLFVPPPAENSAPTMVAPPPDGSSALTTSAQDTSSPELQLQNKTRVEDTRIMRILMQQDGEWVEVKKCRRSSIVEAITEVRRNTPGQWYLFNKDGRGIDLEDCYKHEDDFVCLGTNESSFLEEEEL